MGSEIKKKIARYVEIRAQARVEKRDETENEKEELARIEVELSMDSAQIYAAFARAYPDA